METFGNLRERASPKFACEEGDSSYKSDKDSVFDSSPTHPQPSEPPFTFTRTFTMKLILCLASLFLLLSSFVSAQGGFIHTCEVLNIGTRGILWEVRCRQMDGQMSPIRTIDLSGHVNNNDGQLNVKCNG